MSRWSPALAWAALALAAPALSAEPPADAPEPARRSVVIAAAEVHDGSGRCFRPGEILVQDGRVKEIGSSVTAPASAERWDRADEVITPWLVDPVVDVATGRGETGRNEAALLSAADAAPRHDPMVAELARRGIGAVGLVPAAPSGLSGRGAAMGTQALPGSGAPILADETFACWTLPESLPGSAARAAARQAIGLTLEGAEKARRTREKAKAKDAAKRSRPARELQRHRPGGPSPAGAKPPELAQPVEDILVRVASGKLPILVRAARQEDALELLREAEQRKGGLVLVGCRGCAGACREIAESQVVIVLDPLHEPAGDLHGIPGDPGLPGLLAAQGARIAVTGGGGWPEGPLALRAAAGLLVAGGAPPETAIAAMTGLAAEAAGISSHVIIAPGAPARFVAWSASPLLPGSRVRRAFLPADFERAQEASP